MVKRDLILTSLVAEMERFVWCRTDLNREMLCLPKTARRHHWGEYYTRLDDLTTRLHEIERVGTAVTRNMLPSRSNVARRKNRRA